LAAGGQNVSRVGTRFVTNPSDASPRVKEYFDRIKAVASTPELVLRDAAIEAKVQEIGQEIHRELGHDGMVAVCEYNRQYHPFIERAWNLIGDWMA
jgi:hypothetical protein